MDKFNIKIKCFVCKANKEVPAKTQFIGIKEIITETKWGRAVIKTNGGHKKEGWICTKCMTDSKDLC